MPQGKAFAAVVLAPVLAPARGATGPSTGPFSIRGQRNSSRIIAIASCDSTNAAAVAEPYQQSVD